MDSTVSKSTQNLTTEDMRNQIKLVLEPYANWEEYLTLAPSSIAVLGELVFISFTRDFFINTKPPKDGYKYINYPESFRVCLMQLCNSGWQTFHRAHKTMGQIHVYTAIVPDYMKILQHSEENVIAHSTDQLNKIQKIADDCLELSNATEVCFRDVVNIIQELLEACISAEHFYQEEEEKAKRNQKETKLREQSVCESKRRTDKAVNTLEKELEQAHEGNMVGMDKGSWIAQSVTGLVNGMTSRITDPVRSMYDATKWCDNVSQIRGWECDIGVIDEINAYSKSAGILNCAQYIQRQMKVSCKDDEIDWTNLYDQKNKSTKTDFVEKQFRKIWQDLEKISNCSVKTQAQFLCRKGIYICKQLAKYAPGGKCKKNKSVEIIEEVLDLSRLARGFDRENKAVTSGQRATKYPRSSIEQTQDHLKKTSETSEMCVENLEKNQKELTDILITMRQCELKEIDFNTTIEMLVKGMDAMGRLMEQWEKMGYFFQMVSNIVKIFLNKITKFISTVEKTQALSYNAKLFLKDLLYSQAFQACNIASLVNMISGTYTDVSKKYLMECVSLLGKLTVMDKSKPEFELEYQKLQNCCDEAQRGILSLVLKNKEEFDNMSTARLEKIDQQLLAILPPATPEQMKSIEEAVQAGFTEEEEASFI